MVCIKLENKKRESRIALLTYTAIKNSNSSEHTVLTEVRLQTDQDLHFLTFHMHLWDALVHCKTTNHYVFWNNYSSYFGSSNLLFFYGEMNTVEEIDHEKFITLMFL